MKGNYIDTHCHLYLPDFSEDIASVMQRAEKEGVSKFYLPAIDRGTEDNLLSLEQSFPGKCFAMMGLHPCSVGENYKQELEWVKGWLQKREFAAIGETGLDFYWDQTFVKEQIEAFEFQISWALHYDKPVVIHSRNAVDECIRLVAMHQNGRLRGIFHCFSGTYEQAQRILETGFYLGIGGVLTYKNSGLSDVISRVPLEHIVLETDAPYLTPVPHRGKRNESSYLKFVIEKLALIKEVSTEQIGAITTRNAENIFR